jgi:DeoR/GlpR family transcriptional regulator of sugar metabolism
MSLKAKTDRRELTMRGAGRLTSSRRQKLLNSLEGRESVRVSDLAEMFQVSEITIRRDLDELVELGLIERFHGGARLTDRARSETLFEEKPRLHAAEKDSIGAAAAKLVKDGDTVILNGGSTTLSVLRHIRGRDIRIVTNNVAAAGETADSGAELIILGGEYRAKSRSLIGELTSLTLQQIHGGVCILGTNGVSVQAGLTTSVYGEAAINRLMASRCKDNVIVVADGSKVGVVSNFASLPLSQVKVLITDQTADPSELAAIRAAGVETVICAIEDA